MTTLISMIHRFCNKTSPGLAAACIATLWSASSGYGVESLATCGVRTTLGDARTAVTVNLAGMIAEQPDEEMSGYMRGPAGKWIVPEEVDPNDDSVRGVLLTPAGPLVFQIHVMLADRPFRQQGEEWIESALTEKVPSSSNVEAAETVSDEEPSVSSNVGSVRPSRTARFVPSSGKEWLAGYVRTATSPIDRYEARWLLAQRLGGPALMWLQRFSTRRSESAPLLRVLDEDGDGQLSAQEISLAVERVSSCDVNENGSVEVGELERTRRRHRVNYEAWSIEPLFVVFDQVEDWHQLSESLANQLRESGAFGKELTVDQWKRMKSEAADATVRVTFADDKSESRVELLALDGLLSSHKHTVRSGSHTVAVSLSACDVEIEAGQTKSASEVAQVSVGAATEGSPLLHLVDTNGDGRISIREKGNVMTILKGLDTNGNQALEADEIPIRIRLAVALGPKVHDLLALETRSVPRMQKTEASAPDWFVGMDLDHDGDLTRDEFLGSHDKFRKLDKNVDGLISLAEAAQ